MKEHPFPGYEYPFNKPAIFMFPMIKPNTIGIYYGYEDEEKLAEICLKQNGLDKSVLKSMNLTDI
ncbi:MAG: hypothetical protein JW863_04345 [Chitinispirillaceae bacterium]|nr:hypothetical protein [Chitinispirillaceae bacterium]